MISSKLTSKAQTTIPQAVRIALGVGEGDEVAYTIEADRVILRKAPKLRASVPAEDPFGTFTEWDSEADRLAFANL
jgi:antitoxin PrlF